MGSVVDYASLTTAIANWLTRSGVSDFVANIPDFIQQTEERINYGSDDQEFPSPPLRTADMEIAATTLTVLASSNTVTLPSDFLSLRRNYILVAPKNQKLTYMTPNNIDAILPSNARQPTEFFTIQGNTLVLPVALSTSQSVVAGYYQRVPALSTSNTVNWLLAKAPSVYLFGAQLHGAMFVRDMADMSLMARAFANSLRSLQKSDMKGRWSGDALQMKPDQVV